MLLLYVSYFLLCFILPYSLKGVLLNQIRKIYFSIHTKLFMIFEASIITPSLF